MRIEPIDVRPIAGALGAEIGGVDLSGPLDEARFEAVHRAFLDHLVIFFRDQHITPQAQLDFAARFGPPHIHPFTPGMPEHPEILEIVKAPAETRNWGGRWHSDVAFEDEPPLGSVLYAKEVPPFGGDTLFANMYLAYESLSDGMRAMLDGLACVHVGDVSVFDSGYEAMAAIDNEPQVATHPMVRTHPETGRRSLFVSRVWTKGIEGWAEEESRPLLEFLYAHAVRPEFTCQFRWQVNSIAFWDNRCVLHRANEDFHFGRRGLTPHRRRMHRVTVKGDRPR